MDIDRLWEIKRARPFRPFRIVLDDGRTFEVHAPQHWLVSPPMVVIGSDIDENDDLPCTTTMTHPSHVLRIDFLEAPSRR